MVEGPDDHVGEVSLEDIRATMTLAELSALLRRLRRRDARERRDTPRTYRELAAKTGWAHGVIGDYFAGKVLAPTDRFDVLVGLLGASAVEQGELATARDRVEERRRRTPPEPRSRPVVPRELPRDVSAFTGRDAEVAELDALLDSGDAAAVVLSAVSGTAGVGKTALAVHWAHRVADRFPDGCLYVDLRGYAADPPVHPDEALTGFLRSLGLRGPDLPPRGPELAARYRSLLADRRMLVVLDNAHSADQVRPLLPGASSCFVLVTSRDTLAGLVARDGARRVDLDRLPAPESATLLRTLIGSRAEASPEAVSALADRCAHLPLALRIAAELAVTRPASALADVVADLAGSQRRLDLLDAGGDPNTAARGVFSWSYRHLSGPAARTFRLLGLHPGRDFDLGGVAALTGDGLDAARRCLDELAGAHLVEATRPDRYGMHDLLRGYAAELAAGDREDERRAAVTRLLDHYVDTAESAPLAWLDAELPNLVAAANHAAEHGWPGYLSRLSTALWRYLDTGGHYAEALVIHGHAARVAHDHGERATEGAALGQLGHVYARLGRYEEALAHLDRALAINRGIGDRTAENVTLNSLALVHLRVGRYEEALDQLHRALAIDRALGNLSSEGKGLSNLGIVHAQLGRFQQARDHFERALDVARVTGDRNRESEALNNLGLINCRLGQYRLAHDLLVQGLARAREAGSRGGEGRLLANLGVAHTRLDEPRDALRCLRLALEIHREIGDRAAEAEALAYLADLHHRTGQLAVAADHGELALAVAEEIGERSVAAAALNTLGRILLAMGEPHPALSRHEAAATVARAIGDRLQQAAALDGIGHCLHATGAHHQATTHWHQAITIYTDLGMPEADHLRALTA